MTNTDMSPMVTKEETFHAFWAHAQNTTIHTVFGGIEYYLDQAPAQVITPLSSSLSDGLFSGLNEDLFPCTVLNLRKDQLNRKDLDAISAKFALYDDVWTRAFLKGETSHHHHHHHHLAILVFYVANGVTPSNSCYNSDTPWL